MCGKKGLENADKAEGRATFRNKVNFILVRTIKGWNFMQRFWPTNRKTTPQGVNIWKLKISKVKGCKELPKVYGTLYNIA